MPTISGIVYDDQGNPTGGRIVRAYRRDTGAFIGASVSSTANSDSMVTGVTDGLISWHKFKEDFNDSIGTNHGTAVGTIPAYVEPDGTSVRFPGQETTADTNPGGVRMPNPVQALSTYTILWWGKVDSAAKTLGTGDNTVPRVCWMKTEQADWNPGVWMNNYQFRPHATAEYTDFTMPFSPNDSNWQLYGMVRNGNDVYSIIEGVRRQDPYRTTSYSPGAPSSEIMIGRLDQTTNHPSLSHDNYGAVHNMTDLRWYNRVLTDDDVNAIYAEQFGLLNPGLSIGEFRIVVSYTGEVDLVVLDDDAGTTYNDKIQRIIVS